MESENKSCLDAPRRHTGKVMAQLCSVLSTAIVESQCSASLLGRFNPGERAPVPLKRMLDGPQRGSGCFGEEKNLFRLR
jgi:hypothetical protein